MSHGLLWLPLLVVFVLLTALGWLERRRQRLFRSWAEGSELAKLDGCGAARLQDGVLTWSSFEAGQLKPQGSFVISKLELLELMALGSGDAPLTEESQGHCRIRLVGKGEQVDLAFSDAERARRWMHDLMARSRCEL
ncbi:hypothetical protein KQ306_11655 [Synechococcus sp. CS-1324]|uniref:hypothetical protein n=1 Tax=unclassified Synechococcus TaxID=2626047 RepID=UPI000DB6B677|nr:MULTISPECIES: hypothetical protein [unclassified Synechococcus]MCT0212923.1 hypothetical protein [Synechococcus sp. CS-1326]MCT0231502.1 hypothetical protein [Synechococcus sp. CS-1324]MCT0233127.1 hypothetical protein [Synechococcus sp. CS-1327]PZV03907.1 MAG: hypothetical protein DCF23_07885 [Cyanobium sp.]